MFARHNRRVNAALSSRRLMAALLFLCCASATAQSPELRLHFDQSKTTIAFTLGDVLHTVHGSFQLKSGDVQYNIATKFVTGNLIVDATSGQSGNHSRDHKMHKEILESARYPIISFRPDRVEGNVATLGASNIQVHGMFSIHGADHELTMPIRVEVFPDHWTADTHFTIPYVKWGIKNPSTFILRVSESVEIDVHASGVNPSSGGAH
ncbi:MAG: YceI family protein [Terriglobales bacterium]